MHRTRQWNGQYECCHSNKNNKAFHYSNITDRTGLQQHKGAYRSCLQALTSLYTSILLYRYLHLTLINETTSSIQIKCINAMLCFKKKKMDTYQ